jgi:murein DD-endopeptidase MepM/ murein hydrolase activator NlpD
MKRLGALLAGALMCAAAANATPDLRLPLACALGQDCFVQNWVDADPGPGRADPTCGPLTYDGHDGLDFRVTWAAYRAGAPVISPAPATVLRVRDGEPDGVFRKQGAGAIAGKDCGNGVVLALADGLEAQLCHLKQSSIRVRAGQKVAAGEALGSVGLSGRTEFPHLHLSLRRSGEKLDPATGAALKAAPACSLAGAAPAGAIWRSEDRARLSYVATALVDAAFLGRAPAEGERPEDINDPAGRTAPALLFWASAMGPRTGDIVRVRIIGPNGAEIAAGERTQPRDQAAASVFAGKRTPPGGWPPGTYRGEAVILRAGKPIASRTVPLILR